MRLVVRDALVKLELVRVVRVGAFRTLRLAADLRVCGQDELGGGDRNLDRNRGDGSWMTR